MLRRVGIFVLVYAGFLRYQWHRRRTGSTPLSRDSYQWQAAEGKTPLGYLPHDYPPGGTGKRVRDSFHNVHSGREGFEADPGMYLVDDQRSGRRT